MTFWTLPVTSGLGQSPEMVVAGTIRECVWTVRQSPSKKQLDHPAETDSAFVTIISSSSLIGETRGEETMPDVRDETIRRRTVMVKFTQSELANLLAREARRLSDLNEGEGTASVRVGEIKDSLSYVRGHDAMVTIVLELGE